MISRIKSERYVITALNETLKARSITVKDTPPSDKSKFPYIAIQTTDAPETVNTVDNSGEEKCIDVTYQIDTYSNKASGAGTDETEELMDIVMTTMRSLNFRCTVATPMPKLSNSSISRYTATFVGRFDGKGFYGR